MKISEIDLNTLVDKAEDAFWQVVVRRYPTVKTGDLSPSTTMDFQQAARRAISEWIWANVPDPRPSKTYFNDADGHTYWLNSDGDLVAAPTFQGGLPDWDNWNYVEDFGERFSDTEKQRIMATLGGIPT
jgi:hypothetical protein